VFSELLASLNAAFVCQAGVVIELSEIAAFAMDQGPHRTPCAMTQVKQDLAKLQLTSPVCTKEGEKIALSRRVEKHWRLIGWGQIQKGLKMDLPTNAK
jgi:translation initiation factor 2 subunit 3